MSRRQPTLREAEEQCASVERMVAAAAEVIACSSRLIEPDYGEPYVTGDGFWIRFKRQRSGFGISWPFSDVSRKCADCGCVLRAQRDCGCDGFFYDRRWLTGNPAERNPIRDWEDGASRYVCLPCFNRIRPKIRAAQAINETRLLIHRIKREATHAA